MSKFSHPWNDEDGVRGLWPRLHGPRNEQVWERIKTRRAEHLRLCRIWKAAAEADGWVFSPTYQTEPVEHAFRGTKDGFVIQGIARPGDGVKSGPSASIHIWGPDGLSINTPLEYSMEAIRAGTRHCNYCNADDVQTTRVSFAGRCCHECLPRVKKQLEYPGWTK